MREYWLGLISRFLPTMAHYN